LTDVNFASAVHDVSPTLNWGVRGEQSESGKRLADAVRLRVIGVSFYLRIIFRQQSDKVPFLSCAAWCTCLETFSIHARSGARCRL